jgi:deoxyribose-phosphate aldolase
MEAFVLIVYVWATGSSGGNAVNMHEFTTLAHCDNARKVVTETKEAKYYSVTAVCVPK